MCALAKAAGMVQAQASAGGRRCRRAGTDHPFVSLSARRRKERGRTVCVHWRRLGPPRTSCVIHAIRLQLMGSVASACNRSVVIAERGRGRGRTAGVAAARGSGVVVGCYGLANRTVRNSSWRTLSGDELQRWTAMISVDSENRTPGQPECAIVDGQARALLHGWGVL
jgi:hypothetical protein